MRIENAINEIQGRKPIERREAEVKRHRNAPPAGDVVEISKAARALGSRAVSRADLEAVSDVRQARVEEVRQRVATGFYDRPEVRRAIAETVLDSGVVDDVGQEAGQVRATKELLPEVPDVREDRVALARQRVASAYYDSANITSQVADRVLDALIG